MSPHRRKFKEYRKAPIERKNEILSEVRKLYDLDQSLKINLIINGPAILDDSQFLLSAKDEYNRNELLKDYNRGKYQNKGLVNNPKVNIRISPYERKENTGVSDINSYLRNLRIGVER